MKLSLEINVNDLKTNSDIIPIFEDLSLRILNSLWNHQYNTRRVILDPNRNPVGHWILQSGQFKFRPLEGGPNHG